MATTFTFPRNPKVGDRIEFVGISEEKLPIQIVGNAEAGKNLKIIMPDQVYTSASDGVSVVLSLNYLNAVFTFKCVSTGSEHVWVLEGSGIYALLKEALNSL